MCVGGGWFTDSLVHWQQVDCRFSKRKSTSRFVFLDGKDGCLCRRRMIHQTVQCSGGLFVSRDNNLHQHQHWQLTSSWHLSVSTALDPPPRVDISTQSRYPRYLRSCSCDPRLYHRQTEGLGPAPGVQQCTEQKVNTVQRSLQSTAYCLLLWSTEVHCKLMSQIKEIGLWWLLT